MLYHGVWSSGRMRASGACGPSSILGTPTFRLRSRSLRPCIYSLIWYDLAMNGEKVLERYRYLVGLAGSSGVWDPELIRLHAQIMRLSQVERAELPLRELGDLFQKLAGTRAGA